MLLSLCLFLEKQNGSSDAMEKGEIWHKYRSCELLHAFKETLLLKMEIRHHLLNLKSIQTYRNFVDPPNKQKRYYGSQWCPRAVMFPTFFEISCVQ